MKSTISENDHALLRLPSEGMKIVELRGLGTINLGKFGAFHVLEVLGYPYGQVFECVGDKKVKPIKAMDQEPEDDDLNREELTQAFSENNQNIINMGSKIQKLTSEQIDELKLAGATSAIGQQIIEKIIQGHGGFDKKTIFSQQKYLRRKQQKFLRRFQIEPLGASQLLEYYVSKDIQKVHDLSDETLGLMLNYGNVRPGGKYLVVDDLTGVLIYAMLERMNGQGTIVSVHENEHPNHTSLKYSGLTEDEIDAVVKPISWLQLLEPASERVIWEDRSEEYLALLKTNKRLQYYRKKKRADQTNSTIDIVTKGNFDGFVCLSTLELPTILPHVLPLIGGSRPIVIYSQYKELVLEAQHFLTEDRRVLAPSIFESRVRHYQTIPGRMHPMMTSIGYGGYVLWGTRVFPKDDITAVGRGITKRQKVEKKTEENKIEETPEQDESS